MVSIDDLKKYVGLQSEVEEAPEPVERGAVRVFAQAVMDENPIYDRPTAENQPYGGPIAPPLFPQACFKRPFGSPDNVQANARNPDFDGYGRSGTLPSIPELSGFKMLNGGTEIDFFRYARHGEQVTRQLRYADIYEKETSKGRMFFVVTETMYRTKAGEPLLRTRSTLLWR